MSVSADDVASKKFTTVRGFKEGYAEPEVDEFLEQVESTLRHLQSQVAQLEASKPSVAASQVLELAQATADALLADAREQSEKMMADARRHQAETTASLQQQVEALNAKIAELSMIERDYRDRLKQFVSSALNDLD